MLICKRKKHERILIGDNIIITVTEIGSDRVGIGVTAPPGVKVDREEIRILKQLEKERRGSGMNVLSLFDGISCGRLALERAGITFDKYYTSEIDKYASSIARYNWPDNIELGDVTKWREWDIDWSSIDLLIGGSPCQGFSLAGKQLAFDDERSKLFFVFAQIIQHIRTFNPAVKFLLENVKMKAEYRDAITQMMGVDPVLINSARLSAQNRERLYWCNWPVSQPEDKGILLKDILETYGQGCLKSHGTYKLKSDKSNCLDSNYGRGVDNHGQRTVICDCVGEADGIDYGLRQRVYSPDGKSPTVQTLTGGGHVPVLMNPEECEKVKGKYLDGEERRKYRKLTPLECERLQTLPDNYTAQGVDIHFQYLYNS